MFRPCLLTLPAIWLAAAATSSCVSAQEPDPATDAVVTSLDAQVTKFFDAVKIDTTDTAAAYEKILLADAQQILSQREAVAALVEKTNLLAGKYGALRAVERVSAKRVGQDLVLLKYIYKCERYPVVWYFTYYRSPTPPATAVEGRWVLVSVRFDTMLEQLGR